MAESGKSGKSGKESKKQKKSWFKGLKSEFNKIIWTDRVTLENRPWLSYPLRLCWAW